MSYCRFQNTVKDLRDCHNNLFEELEGNEKLARIELVHTCMDILMDLGVSISEDEVEDVREQLKEYEQ